MWKSVRLMSKQLDKPPVAEDLNDLLVNRVARVTALQIVCVFGQSARRAFSIPERLDRIPALDWLEAAIEVRRLPMEAFTTARVFRVAEICATQAGKLLVLPFVAQGLTYRSSD